MRKLYLRPSIEIVISEAVIMDTDSTGHLNGDSALAKPNDPFFDWDDNNEFGDLWAEADNEEDF